MKPDKFGFDKKIKALEKAKYDLPNDLAQAGQLYFQQNFKKQQWDGKKWENVQRRIPGTDAYKYPKNKGLSRRKKPILVGDGILKQSLQNSVRFKSYKKITWGNDVSYSKYLNFGTDKMPQRQFMGINKEFIALMKKKINFAFKKVVTAK
jgi:phage gpG-like protein